MHNSYLDWFDNRTPSKHPVFGKITEGWDIVQKIGNTATGKTGRDRPNTPIQVRSITIIE